MLVLARAGMLDIRQMRRDQAAIAWGPLQFRADWALFLDLDGTVLDLAASPREVAVPPDLVSILAEIARGLDGALAVLSGRSIADIDRLLAPLDLAAAGQHGAELRVDPAGPIVRTVRSVRPPYWHRRLARLTRLYQGVLVEDKGLGIAVHYRNAPEAEAAVGRALEGLAVEGAGFALKDGRRVREIVPLGCDKGRALRLIMSRPPFACRIPVAVGDDVTDEDAFAAALALGGRALRVGSCATVDAAFPGPSAVRDWLAAGAAALARAKWPA